MPILLVIAQVLGAVIPAIGALKAALPGHAASGGGAGTDSLTALLTAIENLVGQVGGQTWATPTTIQAALADLAQALADVGGSGLVTGSALDLLNSLQADLGKITTQAANYTSGQAALLFTNFSYSGMPGDIVAVARGGAAAAALGL